MKHYKPEHKRVLPSVIAALIEARPHVVHFADTGDDEAVERAKRVLAVIDAARA